ncbi:spermidine/putrescine transport system permease protein [Tistlia consotensis]|uniref:Spermidine/putrescine transport system permease protein n=1 Tax=Tistlia consotensis USBA 355 TaxID=560819 RepID=A0A1Y6BBZ0_9PROT|nr:ABC transporter permease [Tistlia consotensis]SME96960.1 spermidine/putrescine transport system permease protein [Tistlia consotensis USBA 355]SNR56376.1 spermidine/putrescine transport system permease protein [Tistlia consotensis]
MRDLVRSYGKTLTTIFVALVCFWVLIMIVLPQAFMIEQSLWTMQRDSALGVKIDRAYADLATMNYDLGNARDESAKTALQAKIDALQAGISDMEQRETKPHKIYGLQNYTAMSGLHFRIFVKSIVYALAVTVLALLVCYPLAFTIAKLATPQRAALLLLGLVIPYAINELLRVYAWLMILDYQGVINSALEALGLVSFQDKTWVPFLEYSGSVFVALIYAYVLFMVFPIYNTVETLDKNQLEAAEDLGGSIWRTHWRVVIPHAKPGIAVGCIMTFMLSVGSYSVPQIMTRGKSGDWFSQLIYRQFFETQSWNLGAAYAFSLVLVCLVFILLMMKLFGVGIRDIAK